MDQDGLFLMLKMCNGCSHNKGSWKKCMSRRHNPRMSTVRKEELTFGHRQCVKPDQPITIYKLRDHETNEEFLEFDEAVIFQTACSKCLNIKSCINSGHKLVDWRPTFAGGRVAGTSPPAPAQTSAAGSGGSDSGSGSGSGGGGGGGVKKSRGGATPTKTKGGKATASAGAAAAEAGEGAGEGRNAPSAGRKGGRGGGGAAAAAAAGGAPKGGAQRPASPPKVSHKRKSPGAVPAAKSSSKGGSGEPPVRNGKAVGKRGGAKRVNPAPVGGTKRGRRRSSADDLDDATKMEIDTDSSGVGERPPKRRGRQSAPAAVTPSPKAMHQDSFEAGGDDEEAEAEAGAASDGDDSSPASAPPSPPPPPPPPAPKTVAEKLELVKSEESELLRQFEETHKRSAQEEKAKREEMAEFQRAGEAALRTIQDEKEEVLRRISEERKIKAAERQQLVRQRLKEFEAEEEASRVEARERDARLEAEKERLSKASTSAAAAAAANGTGKGSGTAADAADANGSGDGDGDDGPGWTADSWTHSGVTSSELKRVAAQNARRAGQGGAAKKPGFVKNEKTSEKAAAVAKLLAGTAAGDGDGREATAGDVSEEQAPSDAEEGADGEAGNRGVSGEEQAAAAVVPASAGEESGGSPQAKGDAANGGGGEAAAAAPHVVAGDASVFSAVSATEAGDGKPSPPSPPDAAVEEAPTSVDGAAAAAGGAKGGGGGGVVVPGGRAVSHPAKAEPGVEAAVSPRSATGVENGDEEEQKVGSSARGDAAAGTSSR